MMHLPPELVLAAALFVGPAAASSRLDVIDLPTGFFPEGITAGEGWTAYVGSLVDGSIWKGDLSTGEGEVIFEGEGDEVVGLDYDRRSGYTFACGGNTGTARVYDKEFDLVADFALAVSDTPGSSFVNDVTITDTAAYFTDSVQAQIYSVELNGTTGKLADGNDTVATTITLDGFEIVDGVNGNGIVASEDGSTLIVSNAYGGKLYNVDPVTGAAAAIDLGNNVTVNGDGLVLRKNTLWAVENSNGYISEISLSADMTCGSVAPRVLTHPLFDRPSTAMRKGNSLYVVSAKFDTAMDEVPTTSYEITRVDRDDGEYVCDSE